MLTWHKEQITIPFDEYFLRIIYCCDIPRAILSIYLYTSSINHQIRVTKIQDTPINVYNKPRFDLDPRKMLDSQIWCRKKIEFKMSCLAVACAFCLHFYLIFLFICIVYTTNTIIINLFLESEKHVYSHNTQTCK